MNKRFMLSFIVGAFAIIGLLPVLQMFVNSVMVDGHISFVNYKALVLSSHAWILLKNSLLVSLLTTTFAMVIGVPLGILIGKTDLPFRNFFRIIFIIPLLLPTYVTAVAWFAILGREGFLSRVIGIAAAGEISSYLFGLPGCVLVFFTTFMPIVMFLTATYVKTVNTHLEEAARLVAPWKAVVRGIIMPMILPGILLSSILVFLLSLGEFSVPMFLRYDVFPVESFTQFSAFYNYSAGTAFVIPLIIITFLILLGERKFLRDKTYQLKPAGAEESLIIKLGSMKWPIVTLIGAFCFITVVMPILALIIQSVSFATYIKAFQKSIDSLARSICYAAIGATILTIIGYFFGYLIHKKEFSIWRAVDSLTIFLFALPSTVIGIGLAGLWNRPLTNFIYGSAAIIIFGYIAQYTALTSRITVSMFGQIPPSMEEAAQMAGAGWFRRVSLILAPLAKRGIIASWLVSYIFCLKDTGISMIVYPPGHDTFTVRTFTLMANSPSNFVAALCVIMIAVTLLPMGLLAFLYRPKGL